MFNTCFSLSRRERGWFTRGARRNGAGSHEKPEGTGPAHEESRRERGWITRDVRGSRAGSQEGREGTELISGEEQEEEEARHTSTCGMEDFRKHHIFVI